MGEVRIGTRERELAMGALDEHMRAGRLDPVEYAERSAAASTARMRSELDALFTDLPEPHPTFPKHPGDRDAPAPGSSPPVAATPGAGRTEDDLPELVGPAGAAIGRHAGLVSALTPVAVFVLVAATGFRFVWLFLLVPVILAVVGWLGHRHDQGPA